MGLVNAAVWFGAAIFFTLGVGPGVFSQDMHKLFGETAFQYYAGGVALVLIKRYFILQYICGTIALLHLFAEWLYLGRKTNRLTLGLLVVLFSLSLMGGLWLQPKMQTLRQTMYLDPSPERKDLARRSFGAWHGVSQFANLIIIAGLIVYLVRVTRPPEAGRYGNFTKFRS
ncbi:MAG: hypothetical protein JWR69_2685 [Pedosphaera sp.]|nr:hypothetical protein [Pedosphaera sp.]